MPAHKLSVTLFYCRLSDALLDDLLSDVAEELHGACDDFAENVYMEEFAVVKPSTSPTQPLIT